MPKIMSLEALQALRKQVKGEIELREKKNAMSHVMMHILVCGGTGCISSKSEEIVANSRTKNST